MSIYPRDGDLMLQCPSITRNPQLFIAALIADAITVHKEGFWNNDVDTYNLTSLYYTLENRDVKDKQVDIGNRHRLTMLQLSAENVHTKRTDTVE